LLIILGENIFKIIASAPAAKIFCEGHLVVIHPEQLQINSGHGLDEALVAGRQLELAEEAGAHAAGRGAAEAHLGSMLRFKKLLKNRRKYVGNYDFKGL
jgi:hypothetical protein